MITLNQYRKLYSEDTAVGWQIIENHLDIIYPQLKPSYTLSNANPSPTAYEPLEGVCHYTAKDFEHYISFGFSELYYNEECLGADFSKFGFELSLRLNTQKDDSPWVYKLFQHLAAYVFESGNWFEANHFIELEGGLTLSKTNQYTAIAFCSDPVLGTIHTPHGLVEFLQIVPLTQSEVNTLSTKANMAFTAKFLQKKTAQNKLSIITL